MRPNYKKWREAKSKPFQAALFIRTEQGRTVDITVDTCDGPMKDAALKLLALMSGGHLKAVKSAQLPKGKTSIEVTKK